MAGALSKLIDATGTLLVESAMGPFFEKVWPVVKYLIERSVLIPLAAMGGIGYGVHLGYVTGDVGAWCIVAIAALVLISRIIKKKGEPQ